MNPNLRRGVFLVVLVGLAFVAGALASARFEPGRWVVSDFAKLYHHGDNPVWFGQTTWLGVPIQKLPSDLQVMQEILWEKKPDVLIEAGTYLGGSALYFATLFDAIGHGRVISLDIEHVRELPQHERITYLIASSSAAETVEKVKSLIKDGETVMVDLDSAHNRDHVLQELRLWSPLVTPGQYLIVEDTNVNGHPVLPDFGPGPMEALDEFLSGSPPFSIDEGKHQKYLHSFNPRGYLCKRPCGSDVASRPAS